MQGSSLPAEYYESIINGMPYGLLVANKNGKFILWNEIAFRLFKIDLRQSKEQEWVSKWGVFELDGITPYKTEQIPLSRALRGHIVENEKLYLKYANDTGMYIRTHAYPITIKGELVAGVVFVEDITREQMFYDKLERKVAEFREQIQNFFNNSQLKLQDEKSK